MKKILVTGGTTFVSKYVAEYFVNAVVFAPIRNKACLLHLAGTIPFMDGRL